MKLVDWSAKDITALVAAFDATSLDKEHWTHAASSIRDLLASELNNSRFSLYFYSYELLALPACGARWHDPDLHPLDQLGRIIGPRFTL